MQLKYSVLMSVYAKENPEYFRIAVESMVNQTVKPDEIVIVQDGPLPSELDEMLREFSEKYPDLITIVVSEENIGLGLALNLGLAQCRNELVARMDTDDISLPERCQKQLKVFSEYPNLSIVGSNIAEFIHDPENITTRRIVPEKHREIIEFLKHRCPMNHVAVMLKKTEVQESGGYQHLLYNEDYYLWVRMFLNGCKFSNISSDLVLVRIGNDMYQRRGGWKYFKSEAKLQKFMLEKKIISFPRFLINVGKRLIVQVLLPNTIRGWAFKRFAREKVK